MKRNREDSPLSGSGIKWPHTTNTNVKDGLLVNADNTAGESTDYASDADRLNFTRSTTTTMRPNDIPNFDIFQSQITLPIEPTQVPRTSTPRLSPIFPTTAIPNIMIMEDNKDPLIIPSNYSTLMLQPSELPRYVKQALGYKKEGLIRISIHRSCAFDTEEMGLIMKKLGVTEVLSRDNNKLIIALAKTGSLEFNLDTSNQLLDTMDMCEDIFPSFDQQTQIYPHMLKYSDNKQTQVNETDIMACDKLLNITHARVFNIPELVVNSQPFVETMEKPKEVFLNKKAFINFSNKQIPESVAIILSFGPKFSVPTYYKQEDFIKLRDTAYAINEAFAQPFDTESIRNHIDNHISEYIENQYIQHSNEVRDFFTVALGETKHFLNNNKDLILTQADKANATIIMDRTTYISKIEQLLADESTYAPLKQSSNIAYQKMNQKLLDRMVNLKWMSRMESIEIIRNETNIANIYALIKNHKEGNPPRPVVNTINTPGYALAKKVTTILTKIRDTDKYNVLHSKSAINQIRTTRILPDMIFCSYDARSMFTNISVERAIQAVINRRDKLQLDKEGLLMIIDVIKFVCTKNSEISFNNNVYKQIKGLRMGSSLSPVLAEFVMDDLLDNIFRKIRRPQLFIKYVDDIMAVTTKEHHQQILTALNNADDTLKFDIEEQNTEGAINYLDFTIFNQPFNIRTKWFQKTIASGRLLNFHTHHTKSVIFHTAVNYVSNMIHNSHSDFRAEMLKWAEHLLYINSYSTEYANKVITTAIQKEATAQIMTPTQHTQQKEITSTPLSTDKQHPIYVTGIPYIPQVSNKIQKHIEASASQLTHKGEQSGNFKDPKNIKIASIPIHRMSSETFNKHKKISQNKHITTINIDEEHTPNSNTGHHDAFQYTYSQP